MLYLSDDLNGTHLKGEGKNRCGPQVSIHRECDKTAHMRERGLTRQLNERVVLLVPRSLTRASSTQCVLAPNSLGRLVDTAANFSGRRRAWYPNGRRSLSERQDHDIRNDQTLPNLQAAINQARTNRYRALLLRQTCLAGIAP